MRGAGSTVHSLGTLFDKGVVRVMRWKRRRLLQAAVLLIAVALSAAACASPKEAENIPAIDADRAARVTYVPPGKMDDYYVFVSGGHSGNVHVYGLPSLRLIRTIPVFAPDPATGYGIDVRTKPMLRGYTWGDLHHAAISETDGRYDGRWLFASDLANNRVARIDLSTFTTEQILGPIPHISGPHCSVFVTPNTEYMFLPSRFATPVPSGTYRPLSQFGDKYYSSMAAVTIDKVTGEMALAWQLLLPPWQFEMSDAGKLTSDGWAFLTAMNSEEATRHLEIEISQKHQDYLLAINWRAAEEAVAEGKYRLVDGVKMLDPGEVKGIVYLLPAPKSPHGVEVSPDGRYVVVNGKLEPVVTVFDMAKVLPAVRSERFIDHQRGLPVLDSEAVMAARVEVGVAPLHTQFGPEGMAYTALFAESKVVKWQLGTWRVLDKIQVAYNVGHVAAIMGDTVEPQGGYLLSLNKLARGRFLPVGPTHPDNIQLIDISGKKMKLLAEAPAPPEPHMAQIVPRKLLSPMAIYPPGSQPGAIRSEKEARVVRDGNRVEIFMAARRSDFAPDVVEVNEGDEVIWHVTNVEEDPDIVHGLGITLYNINVQAEPGQTRTVRFVADKPGVFAFYCTNFCSALHEEQQGWFLVREKRE